MRVKTVNKVEVKKMEENNNVHLNEHSHSETGHNHDVSTMSGKKIFWVTVLNATITVTEIVGGIVSGSLALLSDAVHNLSDTVAIALSYFAFRIGQKPKSAKKTFGYKRAEILSAFINSAVLVAISLVLIVEAFKRWQSPGSINGDLMMIVAIIALIANLVSVFLLEKDSHGSLNIKASYLHLLGDAMASAGVLLGAITIKFWNVIWVDPLITVIISIYISFEAWKVIKKTVDILMQSSADLDYESIKRDVEVIAKVKNIHHVHSWMIDEKTIYFEAHIEMEDMHISEAEKIYDLIEDLLKEHYGISHVTLQVEVDKCDDKRIFKI